MPVKVFRSNKLYLPLLTTLILFGLFALYYFLYISSQHAYYNERAFRVLSVMSDKLTEKAGAIRDVLAASISDLPGPAARKEAPSEGNSRKRIAQIR